MDARFTCSLPLLLSLRLGHKVLTRMWPVARPIGNDEWKRKASPHTFALDLKVFVQARLCYEERSLRNVDVIMLVLGSHRV